MDAPTTWAQWLAGHWTQDPFTKPGTYMVADASPHARTQSPAWNKHVVVQMSGGALLEVSGRWGGYHWSEPLPELPSVAEGTFSAAVLPPGLV